MVAVREVICQLMCYHMVASLLFVVQILALPLEDPFEDQEYLMPDFGHPFFCVVFFCNALQEDLILIQPLTGEIPQCLWLILGRTSYITTMANFFLRHGAMYGFHVQWGIEGVVVNHFIECSMCSGVVDLVTFPIVLVSVVNLDPENLAVPTNSFLKGTILVVPLV